MKKLSISVMCCLALLCSCQREKEKADEQKQDEVTIEKNEAVGVPEQDKAQDQLKEGQEPEVVIKEEVVVKEDGQEAKKKSIEVDIPKEDAKETFPKKEKADAEEGPPLAEFGSMFDEDGMLPLTRDLALS